LCRGHTEECPFLSPCLCLPLLSLPWRRAKHRAPCEFTRVRRPKPAPFARASASNLIFSRWWAVQWEGGGKVPGSFFRLIRRYGWEGECGGTRRHTSGHPSCLPPRLSLALFLSLSLLGLHLCKTLTSLCQSLDAFLVAIGVPPEVLPLCPPSTPQIWWHLQRGEISKEQVG